MLALLRPGPFRRYIIGSVISDTGTWMQVMAQGWLMSTLTNKAILLGMVNFAAGIPTLALTMLGGSVADKYDKRKILIWTQFAQTAPRAHSRDTRLHRPNPRLACRGGGCIFGNLHRVRNAGD